ncbi:MAG: hypothetical protein HW403_237 [Dehalococcoidia bacterium]|nr:hypothetical protein [Dehalococcoidia bacterium]
MEFTLQYTKEQEEFRNEVQSWLDVNSKIPPSVGSWPLHDRDVTDEQVAWCREFYSKLGQKGWFYPLMPKEYGGGGLTLDHDIIIKEEMDRYQVPGFSSAGNVSIAALYVYGTEEQKQRFLRPMLQGEAVTWLLWTEPDSGVDLASVRTRAIRDGDDYVFNGVKCYISGRFDPDYLWILAVTDPEAPRHANLGHFYMPANLPGISWQYQELINRGAQHFVFFDNVRVPREYLVGGESQGWQVAQSSLELEHGAAGGLFGREAVVEDLVKSWQEGKVPNSLAHGDAAKEHLVTAYIRSHVETLIARRNFWMFNTKQPQSYHGPQKQWFGRETRIRTAEDLLELLGPHSLVNDQGWGLMGGRVEQAQRGASMATHGGGSYEIDKVIIARRVGMSRTKEVMAPTHGGAAG